MDNTTIIPHLHERNLAFGDFAKALVDAFSTTGIQSRRIGYLLTIEDFSVSGFGFAETDSGFTPWFATTSQTLRSAQELHTVTDQQWDTVLMFIDLDTEYVRAKYFTDAERRTWLEDLDDYVPALDYYQKWLETDDF